MKEVFGIIKKLDSMHYVVNNAITGEDITSLFRSDMIEKAAQLGQALKYNEEQDAYRLTYADFLAPLTKAIQELDTRTQALKLRVGLV